MFDTIAKDYKSMVADVVDIAYKKGLFNENPRAISTFRNTLVLTTLKGKTSRGGQHNRKPWVGISEKYINNPSRWDTVDSSWVAPWKEYLAKQVAPLRGKKAQFTKIIKQLESGKVAWTEYNKISNDPEIGDWVGDPEKDIGAPLALVICHEIAHAIDYYLKKPGYGNHGPVWQKIYRVLRTNYLSDRTNFQYKSFSFPDVYIPEKVKQIPLQVKTFVQEGLFTTPQTQLQLI